MPTHEPETAPHAEPQVGPQAEPHTAALVPGSSQHMTQQLRGENAAVRELLLALSVGFTLPGPLPSELER
jgi:hypothetical protein